MPEKNYYYNVYLNEEMYERNGSSISYGFYGSQYDITLTIAPHRAVITIGTNTNINIEDLWNFGSGTNSQIKFALRDAYRKVYIFHAILFDSGLKVNKMWVSKIPITNNAAGDLEYNIYDNTTPNFPFVISIFSENGYSLFKGWNLDLCQKMATIKTSQQLNDNRFAAIESFLLSHSKIYEIDTFRDLWTSVNAYYNYMVAVYNQKMKDVISSVVADIDSSDRTEEQKADFKKRLDINKCSWLIEARANDRLSLSALMEIIITQITNNQKHIVCDANTLANCRNCTISSLLGKIAGLNALQIETLYDDSISNIESDTPFEDDDIESLNDEIKNRFGVPLYLAVSFILSYELRNGYFHGNKTTPAIYDFNNKEISMLKLSNFFLMSFLNEYLPSLFDEENFLTATDVFNIFELLARTRNATATNPRKKYERSNNITSTSSYDLQVYAMLYDKLKEEL